jgi:hypothetical protein
VGNGASRRAHHLSTSTKWWARCGTAYGAVETPHLPLIPDRAEMLVDAEDDQDEFRGDPRKHHADHDSGDRGQQHDESAERADRHRGKRRKDSGQAEQYDQADDQPVESLDDRGCDEAVPLKQILKIEHRWFSGESTTWSQIAQG